MKKEVEFSILVKTSDMYDFLLKHMYSNFSGKFGVVMSIGALVLLAVQYNELDAMKKLMLLAIGSLFLVINPIQLFLKAKRNVTLIPMFQEPLHYSFTEEGFRVRQNEEELSLEWGNISKVIETNRNILIYLSNINAYIFPKDQLKEKEVESDFLQVIKEYVDNTKLKLKKK